MKTITIMPRRAGKTTALLKNFKEHLPSGKEGIFVTINQNLADTIKRENPEIRDYVYSSYSFSERGFGYGRLNFKKKLFLDEYFIYDDEVKKELYNYRHYDITTFSTSNKLYYEKAFNFVRFAKENNVDYWAAKEAFYCMFCGYVFDEYYYNFITDPDCVIYSSGLRTQWFNRLGREGFEVDIMGEWKE